MIAQPLYQPLFRPQSFSLDNIWLSNNYLPEALEFFSRANVTDASAKQDINTFIIGCQELGIWDKLVYVPCLPSHGGRHQLGGAAQRTNTPWALVNATDVTDGVKVVRNGVSNYLRSDQFVNGNDPAGVSFGHMAYQDVYEDSLLNVVTMITRVGNTPRVLGSASYGAIQAQHLRYIGSPEALLSNFGLPAFGDKVNTYRLSRMHAGSTNGTTAISLLVENNLTNLTHSTNVGFVSSQLSFYPLTNYNTQSGVLQGCFLYYDTMATLGNDIWKLFRNLIAQTILSRLTPRGNTRILVTGQSNAGSEFLNLRRVVSGNRIGPNEIYSGGQGGVLITTWVGTGTYSRQNRYRLDFWDNSNPPPMQSMWLKKGRYKNVIYWVQGESDTQDATSSSLYLERLTTLMNWVREDYQDDGMCFVIALIDYSPALRSQNGSGFSSNFTLSNMTGDLSVLNGTWTFTAITGYNDPYIWNNGIYRLRLNNNTWEFINTSTSAVLASSNSTPLIAHPAIASGWTNATANPISPTFSGTRLEWTERVRKAQRDVCSILPNASYFDTRPFYRPDGVHFTDTSYAYALREHMLQNITPYTFDISGFAYPLETLTSPFSGQWTVDDVPVGSPSTTFEVPLLSIGSTIRCGNSKPVTVWHPNNIGSVTRFWMAAKRSFNTASPEVQANDGQTVRRWTSSAYLTSTIIDQATANSQPTYRANAQGGNPALRFDGVDDNMFLAADSTLSGATQAYIIIGANTTNVSGTKNTQSAVLYASSFGTKLSIFPRDGSNFVVGGRRISGTFFSASSPFVEGYNVIGAHGDYSNGFLRIRVNGVVANSTALDAAGASATGNDAVYIGSNTAGNTMEGDLTAVCVINNTISATDLSRIERYIGLLGGLNTIQLI